MEIITFGGASEAHPGRHKKALLHFNSNNKRIVVSVKEVSQFLAFGYRATMVRLQYLFVVDTFYECYSVQSSQL